MKIMCPQCEFSRELSEANLPKHMYMATCPKCACRFKFREKPEANASQNDDLSQNQSVLPPNAIVRDNNFGAYANKKAETENNEQGKINTENQTIEDFQNKARQEYEKKNAQTSNVETKAEHNSNSSSDTNFSQDDEQDPDNNRQNSSKAQNEIVDGVIAWELAKTSQMPFALYHTMLQVLFSSQLFFMNVGKSVAPLFRACIFYVILGTLQSIADRVWLMSKLQTLAEDTAQTPGIDTIAQDLNIPLLFLTMPPLMLLQLFFYSASISIMLRLVEPERANFATIIRVVAFSAAPAIFSIIPMVGQFVSPIWFAFCVFIGCKYALNITWSKTAMAIIPLYILFFVISIYLVKELVGM